MRAPANIGLLTGDAGAVRLAPLPMPAAPGADGLLVRMLFAPINPADLLVIDGHYSVRTDADAPIGAEGVAVVEQTGPGVTDLRRGDLVLPLDRGSWARYRRVDRARVLPVPPGLDLHQAAMLRINPATAWLLLDASAAAAGDCIVQNAATSAVAHWIRRLAPARGVTVIDVVRPGSARAGDDAVVDDGDLERAIRDASGGRPIRAALDCIAGDASGRLAACLDPDGLLLVFGHLSGRPCSIPSPLLTGRGLAVRGFSLRPAEARMTRAARDAMMAALGQIALQDRSGLPVRAVVPIAQADRAIALARAPGRGRVLLDLT